MPDQFCEGKKQVDLKIHFIVPKAQIINKKYIFVVTEPWGEGANGGSVKVLTL